MATFQGRTSEVKRVAATPSSSCSNAWATSSGASCTASWAAFLFLLAQPYGRWLVGIIALGFVALGVHPFACARWVRLMGSPS
jgi:hypothetical protein